MSRAVFVAMSLAVLGVSASVASAQEVLYSPVAGSHHSRALAQAALVDQFATNHRRNQEIRTGRQKGFVDTLHEVERASIPVPDDPPIRYPSPERWRQLNSRRREAESSRRLTAREAGQKRIEDALQLPTEVDFVEVPLTDAIEYLKDLHGIEIQLDRYALAEDGLRTDIPITRGFKGISLRSALRVILADFDLTYVVQDDVLLITTQERARNTRKTKVYAIGDLMLPRLQGVHISRPNITVLNPSYPLPSYAPTYSTTISVR